tara:strand:- start:113 stop:352 length:240 start_codon:yes stop_codon:yes gene_type:complete
MSKLFAYMTMDLGWKAVLAFMIYQWQSPFAGQEMILATIAVSGMIQMAYLLSYKPGDFDKPKAPTSRKKPTPPVKEKNP